MTIHDRYSVGDIVTPSPNKQYPLVADLFRDRYGLIVEVDSDDVSPRLTLYGVYWGTTFAWAVSDEITAVTLPDAE